MSTGVINLSDAMWRVLVVDDEPAARRGVRQLLAKFPAFQVVGECRNGLEALSSIEQLAPDLVFLDIQMPGVDGFEVVRQRTAERMPLTIFLTAFDQFAIKAFEAQALDYLVKPVTESRFATTMKRVIRQLGVAREQSIIVTTTRGSMIIPVREIDWIESADNYARIWTGGRNHLLRESMRGMEERIRAFGFVRAHRQALVQLASVRQITNSDSGECVAVLVSGTRIPISRRRRGEFVEAWRAQGGVLR